MQMHQMSTSRVSQQNDTLSAFDAASKLMHSSVLRARKHPMSALRLYDTLFCTFCNNRAAEVRRSFRRYVTQVFSQSGYAKCVTAEKY